jgi:stage II sporulation protein D
MKKYIVVILLLCIAVGVRAERVKVRVFSNLRVETLNVSFDLGEYDLMAKADKNATTDSLLEPHVGGGMSIVLQADAQGVKVAINDYDYGTFPEVSLHANDTACIMCLNPKDSKQRTYEGDLIITAINATALRIINDVEFETYVAGVTQSEIYGQLPDIFRVQAVISRTWALRNINKHAKEGYNFCDQVHCQAYLNRCVRPDIMLGVISSFGETIVDKDGALIETPFHANSGGETANSEDVWSMALPYLRSVQDTFSCRMRQTEWTKVIPEIKWLNYFKNTHKLDIGNDSIRNGLLTFTQDERKARIMGVKLTRVRVDWQLRSTYFSVTRDSINHNVVLNGRGYGHGVGLSQEGTIRMCNLGYSYDSIIRHYYTGARVLNSGDVPEAYVHRYINGIEKIIADDKAHPGKTKSKKDDWLGQLFRIHDRQEREEVYEPSKQDLDQDWQYEW